MGTLDFSVGLIPTAPAGSSIGYGFVSRVFAPQAGIPEDPVTGSAHTVLAPYWVDRLARNSLVGLQVSRRSGSVGVELTGERVTITGRAVTVFDAHAGPPYPLNASGRRGGPSRLKLTAVTRTVPW